MSVSLHLTLRGLGLWNLQVYSSHVNLAPQNIAGNRPLSLGLTLFRKTFRHLLVFDLSNNAAPERIEKVIPLRNWKGTLFSANG